MSIYAIKEVRSRKRAFIAIGFIATAFVAFGAFFTFRSLSAPSANTSTPTSPKVMAYPTAEETRQAANTDIVATALATAKLKELTKQQQYDVLKNGDLAQRMEAYNIVKACLEPEAIYYYNVKIRTPSLDLPLPRTSVTCGDLNPGTKDNDSERRALLSDCVRAGCRGAFNALIQLEGPTGALTMGRPDHPGIPEPEFKALVQQGIDAGIKTAEPDVLNGAVAKRIRGSIDPVTGNAIPPTQADLAWALENHVAAYLSRFEGKELPEDPTTTPRAQALIKALPPEIAKQAIEAGKVPRPKEIRQ